METQFDAAPGPPRAAAYGTVLVAEDNEIPALDLHHALASAGFAVGGPFPTCREAEAWLALHTPDLAILDVHLRDGRCDEVVRLLEERHVPFVLCSGAMASVDFAAIRRFEKPLDLSAPLRGVHQILGRP